MKKLFLGTSLLAVMSLFPLSTMAEVSINIGIPIPLPPHISINIPLPPHIRFSAPPRLVVLPETYVYVAPDVDVEIFFYDGWWWRPYDGGWYRSRDYNSGWHHYKNTPSFYHQVPRDWRNDYRDHQWQGHQWNIEPIPHQQVQTHWKKWKRVKHWETKNTWGVEGLEIKQKHGNNRNQGNNSNHSR